jgi:site-specific DNA recombinase
MRKAVLYARVSSDLQKKEGTIESQILELRKQIKAHGNVLVKEYIDDGYSGAMLDRPAMNRLREDLKRGLFDTIYFLNTDRIARELTYQTIIIAEILKHRKQVIINGKDYIHNPENKFGLTVLGAVAELEKAKIAERIERGKAVKLAQGCHPGRGYSILGYDFIHKAYNTRSASLKINEKEAKVVRFIFTEYANGTGVNQIIKKLHEMGIRTKRGHDVWRTPLRNTILTNHAYVGTMYFNKMRIIKRHGDPILGTTSLPPKVVKRAKNEWVGIKVPAIVSRALFDEVQKRVAENKKQYGRPRMTELLSSLVRCGVCGSSCLVLRRFFADKSTKIPRVFYTAEYQCSWRTQVQRYAKKITVSGYHNRAIKAELLENRVLKMMNDVMADPERLQKCIGFFSKETQSDQIKIESEIKRTEQKVGQLEDKRKHTIDDYASGDMKKDSYVRKSQQLEDEINNLKSECMQLAKKIPLLHKTELINVSINEFCKTAKKRLEHCLDFNTKRQLFGDYAEKITFDNGRVDFHGSVPVNLSGDGKSEEVKMAFCITDVIPISESRGRKNRKPNFSVPSSRREYDQYIAR